MKALILSHCQSIRKEIILNRGIRLHDVAPLSSHVEVQNIIATLGRTVPEERAGSHDKHVTPVLEGATELRGIDGETERFVGGRADVDIGVLGDRRSNTSGPAGVKKEN